MGRWDREKNLVEFVSGLNGLDRKDGVALFFSQAWCHQDGKDLVGVFIGDTAADDLLIYHDINSDNLSTRHLFASDIDSLDKEQAYRRVLSYKERGILLPVTFGYDENGCNIQVHYFNKDVNRFRRYKPDALQLSIIGGKDAMFSRMYYSGELSSYHAPSQDDGLLFAYKLTQDLYSRNEVRHTSDGKRYEVVLDDTLQEDVLDEFCARYFYNCNDYHKENDFHIKDRYNYVYIARFKDWDDAVQFLHDYRHWRGEVQDAVYCLMDNQPEPLDDLGADLSPTERKYLDYYRKSHYFTSEFQERPFGKIIGDVRASLNSIYDGKFPESITDAVRNRLIFFGYEEVIRNKLGRGNTLIFDHPIVLKDNPHRMLLGFDAANDKNEPVALISMKDDDFVCVAGKELSFLPMDAFNQALSFLKDKNGHIDCLSKQHNPVSVTEIKDVLMRRITDQGSRSFDDKQTDKLRIYLDLFPEDCRYGAVEYICDQCKELLKQDRYENIPEQWLSDAREEFDDLADGVTRIHSQVVHL